MYISFLILDYGMFDSLSTRLTENSHFVYTAPLSLTLTVFCRRCMIKFINYLQNKMTLREVTP